MQGLNVAGFRTGHSMPHTAVSREKPPEWGSDGFLYQPLDLRMEKGATYGSRENQRAWTDDSEVEDNYSSAADESLSILVAKKSASGSGKAKKKKKKT